MKKLTPNARDKAAYTVGFAMVNEDGDPTTPLSASWTLTNGYEEVVNDRQDVAVASLGTTIYISLTPEDTDYDDGDVRIITLDYTFTSSVTNSETADRISGILLIEDLPL